jgi:nitrite reductase (NO-forming)
VLRFNHLPLKLREIWYKAMTFNGSIPAPAISVHEGDTFEITLENKDTMVHSLDIHGIEGPSQALLASVKPGESKTLRATANNVGVFMYHCDGDNLNGIWEHIASGMYGAIIVHPKNEKPAKEFYVVFGEIYNTADKGLFLGTGDNSNAISNSNATTNTTSHRLSTTTTATGGIPQLPTEIGSFDMSKFIANKPDLILTNGMAYKHMPFIGTETKMILNEDAGVFKVRPGELTRWHVVNAGPRGHSHLILLQV